MEDVMKLYITVVSIILVLTIGTTVLSI